MNSKSIAEWIITAKSFCALIGLMSLVVLVQSTAFAMFIFCTGLVPSVIFSGDLSEMQPNYLLAGVFLVIGNIAVFGVPWAEQVLKERDTTENRHCDKMYELLEQKKMYLITSEELLSVIESVELNDTSTALALLQSVVNKAGRDE